MISVSNSLLKLCNMGLAMAQGLKSSGFNITLAIARPILPAPTMTTFILLPVLIPIHHLEVASHF